MSENKDYMLELSSRSGKVSFRQVLNLMDYIRNETETAPLTEALLQLGQIYRLLDKRLELNLASRMKVSATSCVAVVVKWLSLFHLIKKLKLV